MNPSRFTPGKAIRKSVYLPAIGLTFCCLVFACAVASCGPLFAPPEDQSVPVPVPGLFGVTQTEVEVERLFGDTFDAVVYSPAATDKSGVCAGRPIVPFPAIVFGHGFLQDPDEYESTLGHLASRGYVVIAPRSGQDPFVDRGKLALDMSYCSSFLDREAQTPGSRWYQFIDTARVGVFGHSMGGGCAILAAAADARFRAVAAMAPTERPPSPTKAAAEIVVPSCFIVGTDDARKPTESNALPMYAAVPPPRILISIEGGYHCGFVDVPVAGCDSGSIGRAEQLAITWPRLTAFFDYYLANRPEALDELLAPAEGVAIASEFPVSQ